MVRCIGTLLAARRTPVRVARGPIPVGLVVAVSDRPSRRRYTRVPVLAEARRPRLGERGLCALGTSGRLVQQHLVERRSARLHAIQVVHRALRMESAQVLPEHRAHGALVMATSTTRAHHRSTLVGVRALRAHDVAQAASARAELRRELRL